MRKFATAILCILCLQCWGQTQNNPYYDTEKKVHFGFALGTNYSDVKMFFSGESYRQTNILSSRVSRFPFISLQPVCNVHLRERLDLRFILNFSLTQRNIEFTNRASLVESQQVSSAYLGVPILLKYKSVRHRNWRFYTLGGLEYAYDFESNEGSDQDVRNPNIAFVHHNYYYSYGVGFDLYYPLFKLSPELRIANGFNNVLANNPDPYSKMFDGLRNRMVWLSFFFE